MEFQDYIVADYPGVSTAYASGMIDFNSNCEYLVLFQGSTISKYVGNSYLSGFSVTLEQFTIQPERCPVTYECTAVLREADPTSPSGISCADLTMDLVFDG